MEALFYGFIVPSKEHDDCLDIEEDWRREFGNAL
jgi:hypothetical protein